MAIKKPRTRLINFRISEAEFRELQRRSAESDARSISDYCRDMLLDRERLSNGSPNMRKMEQRLTELEGILIRLADRIGSMTEATASYKS